MKSKDQLLLEQAYQQIVLDKQIHQMFLTEAGLLDKAKQVGGAVVDKAKQVGGAVVDKAKQVGGAIVDKAKSMFGNTVNNLFEVVKKSNPQLFAKLKQAIEQKDEQTLKAIFNDPEVRQQQQQPQIQESLLTEGVVETVKNLYQKATVFATEKPEMAAKIALAGVLVVMAGLGLGQGPGGWQEAAGALAELAARALGGGAVGAVAGGIVGGIQGGWEGAKKKAKTWGTAGAAIGLATGGQKLMAQGTDTDGVTQAIGNLKNLDIGKMTADLYAAASRSAQEKDSVLTQMIQGAFKEISSSGMAAIKMKAEQTAENITRDPAKQMEIIAKIVKGTAEALGGDGSSETSVGMKVMNIANSMK